MKMDGYSILLTRLRDSWAYCRVLKVPFLKWDSLLMLFAMCVRISNIFSITYRSTRFHNQTQSGKVIPDPASAATWESRSFHPSGRLFQGDTILGQRNLY